LLPKPQPSSTVPLQFRLDEATRRRGLQHVAELRRLLAARQAAKSPATTTPTTATPTTTTPTTGERSHPRRAA
jgi:hypothetical protein